MKDKNIVTLSLCAILLIGCGNTVVSNKPIEAPNTTTSTPANTNSTITSPSVSTPTTPTAPTSEIPVSTPVSTPPTISEPPSTPTTITYSAADVAGHNKSTDCWQIIANKIYNVTSYISKHPGGPSIVKGCGQDATAMFDSVGGHASIQNLLVNYYIGYLK